MSRNSPPAGQPAPPREPKKGIEVGLLPFVASIVGLVVVVAVIGAAVWFSRDGDEEPTATKTAATQAGGAVLVPPTITVAVDGRRFTYTVSHGDHQDGDVYQVQSGQEDRIAQMKHRSLANGENEYQKTVGKDQRECGRARLVRNNQYSAWSGMKCEKAEEE